MSGRLYTEETYRLSFGRQMISPYGGLDIVESPLMVETVEDWSRVRSPGRARRRMKRGFRQNVVVKTRPRRDVIQVGNRLFVHPDVYRELTAALAERVDRKIEESMARALLGEPA